MTNSAQYRSWTLNLSFRPATAALAIAIVFALTVMAASAQAQTLPCFTLHRRIGRGTALWWTHDGQIGTFLRDDPIRRLHRR